MNKQTNKQINKQINKQVYNQITNLSQRKESSILSHNQRTRYCTALYCTAANVLE